MKKRTAKAKADLLKRKKVEGELVTVKTADLLSTGYVPLNVAASGKIKGGYGKGLFVMLVGDSSSGKTWLTQTCLAEAARNPEFDDYDFWYDDIERGNLINTRRFFGSAMADRLQPPTGSKADPIYSETVEELYYTLDDKLNSGRPFIYVVDSMDGLVSKDDRKKFDDQKTAHRKGKDAAGSYGMGRAKANSVNLRMMIPRLEKAKSMLIVVFQTRDNVDMFSYDKKTRGGGRAPKFYAHLELWTSIKKKIKKTVLGKPRHVGTIIEIEVKKNRLTGWEGKVEMPFFKRYGVDDVGGCIDYLVEEGHWKKGQGRISAGELGVRMDRESLARHVQDEGLESRLHKLVKTVWTEIEQKSMPDRKPRYT